jgi:hypothetical protein
MDVNKNEIELVSFFIKEIKKELEGKSEIGFIPEEELNSITKQILSMLAKSTVNRYLEY